MEHTTQPRAASRPASAAHANTLSAFRVIPTGAPVGAEIEGVDFSLPVPEDV